MTKREASLSVIMPALNEEENLEAAVETTKQIVGRYFEDWEILIFNDGSSDRTGEIAERLAASDSRLRVFHHTSPKNLGGVYKSGIQKARKEYLVMIPGDNENGSDSLGDIFQLAGQADIIIPYVTNPAIRGLKRRSVSKGFVLLVNLISGQGVKYYNGTVLHRIEILRTIDIKTDSFGYQAEAIVKLIRHGHSYKEVGIELAKRPNGLSKAFHPRNLWRVAHFLGGLAIDVRGTKRPKGAYPSESPEAAPQNRRVL